MHVTVSLSFLKGLPASAVRVNQLFLYLFIRLFLAEWEVQTIEKKPVIVIVK